MSCGYCGVFKLDLSPEGYRLRLGGVEKGKNYEVTFKNSGETAIIGGFDLTNAGIEINLESINTSELILYRQI